MKTKEERANDKIPKIVEIYLIVEISHLFIKMLKKEKRFIKSIIHIVEFKKWKA
jgi:hypothetical protein